MTLSVFLIQSQTLDHDTIPYLIIWFSFRSKCQVTYVLWSIHPCTDHQILHFRCEGMGSSELHLYVDKTEILLIGSVPGIDLPSSLYVGQSDIPFSNAAHSLGIIFDSQLALKEQVNRLSACLPGDQADRFNLTGSFFWNLQNSHFLLCSPQAWLL